jgi:hypothetical protein
MYLAVQYLFVEIYISREEGRQATSLARNLLSTKDAIDMAADWRLAFAF